MRPSIALIAAVACLPFFAVQAKEKPATLPAKDKSEAAQTKDKHVPVSTTFTTDANTKVRVGDNKSATLADIKVGAKVHVTYHSDNGTLIADHIAEVVEPKPANPPASGEHKKHEPKPGEMHAGGIVTVVAANSLTVNVHPPHPKK